MTALRVTCGVTIDVEAAEVLHPAPVVLLVRHASLADSLLTAWVVTEHAGLRPRVVLKRELLADPCLDIVGNRLPNCFVDRNAEDTAPGLAEIERMGATMDADSVSIIFPEGTRANPAKRRRALDRIAERDAERAGRLERLEHVLPPRPAGHAGAAARRLGCPTPASWSAGTSGSTASTPSAGSWPPWPGPGHPSGSASTGSSLRPTSTGPRSSGGWTSCGCASTERSQRWSERSQGSAAEVRRVSMRRQLSGRSVAGGGSPDPPEGECAMSDQPSAWAAGYAAFAGVVLIMIGFFQAVAGLVAIVDDTFYVVGQEYIFQFDVTTWGWIHLLVGLVVLISGFGVFSGNAAARTVGVLVAAISGIAAFMWLPWYPVWAVVIIALDIAVIWALTMHGHDLARTSNG